ncbi:hypothetical protein ACJIZ3_001803 [Penstemon smallii]|uniref:Uncharacterized protein n=1 Tax=Penstemon smallii TaxID=265156 RepID=A0ABD3U4Z8_9LAMI
MATEGKLVEAIVYIGDQHPSHFFLNSMGYSSYQKDEKDTIYLCLSFSTEVENDKFWMSSLCLSQASTQICITTREGPSPIILNHFLKSALFLWSMLQELVNLKQFNGFKCPTWIHAPVLQILRNRELNKIVLIILHRTRCRARIICDSAVDSLCTLIVVILIVMNPEKKLVAIYPPAIRNTKVVTEAKVAACLTSMSMAPNARPRLWETSTLKRTISRERIKVAGSGLRPPIQ